MLVAYRNCSREGSCKLIQSFLFIVEDLTEVGYMVFFLLIRGFSCKNSCRLILFSAVFVSSILVLEVIIIYLICTKKR